MLKVGDPAPQFSATASDGRVVTLGSFTGRALVIYFFPKAFTPGCTVETRGFRDNQGELAELGFDVVGISTDTDETQCRFASEYAVRFPMIGDSDKSITRRYDVKWPLLPVARRVTYVLDEKHVIRAVFWHEFQASKHLDDVLGFARRFRSSPKSSKAS